MFTNKIYIINKNYKSIQKYLFYNILCRVEEVQKKVITHLIVTEHSRILCHVI